jgi:hypothetical protein
MTRCCLCREPLGNPICRAAYTLERTDLPGTGYRCTDHDACRQRVRATIAAHVGLAEVCE